MIVYIIFEKREEGGRPPWTSTADHEFIKMRQADPNVGLGKLTGLYEKAAPGLDVIIAEFENGAARRHALRVVPLSDTVVYIIEDDEGLDDFLEPAPEVAKNDSPRLPDSPASPPKLVRAPSCLPQAPSSIEQHADILRKRLSEL